MPYSVHPNINTLTSLLPAHGVSHIVVCPGSRNAPLTHNFAVCSAFTCHAVTDERSAGFYALGLAQASSRPVAVCVTSGTALLNLAPAVAEAAYQHLPLVVVSADRPKAWIDQLDGQTLPQGDALGRFVAKAVTLPEWKETDAEAATMHWHCNRLVNEALLAAVRHGGRPVHINVPITPPLYDFSVSRLPEERSIKLLSPSLGPLAEEPLAFARPILNALQKARRPVIVMGQMRPKEVPVQLIRELRARHWVVLQEPLSGCECCNGVDEMLHNASHDEHLLPDFILYMGGTLVSKRLKEYLRSTRKAACWRVDEDDVVYDTFQNLRGVVQARPAKVLQSIMGEGSKDWFDYWQGLRQKALEHREAFLPDYSAMLAVKHFERLLAKKDPQAAVHYANSSAVRLACVYAPHYVYCNRGVNGIEGSLSTAAGFSLAVDRHVYCVIGDLSFFYDQNALWNQELRGNLRILLLNNGGGSIFHKFEGLRESPAAEPLVLASHKTSARGICLENDVEYHCARNASELDEGLAALTTGHSSRPVLLEVMTNGDVDWQVCQQYFESL
jgi:2-succinyl-5-enolpyruvyl-6-hydroxy-3-cyclohexene-1-carboxylate synthase